MSKIYQNIYIVKVIMHSQHLQMKETRKLWYVWSWARLQLYNITQCPCSHTASVSVYFFRLLTPRYKGVSIWMDLKQELSFQCTLTTTHDAMQWDPTPSTYRSLKCYIITKWCNSFQKNVLRIYIYIIYIYICIPYKEK